MKKEAFGHWSKESSLIVPFYYCEFINNLSRVSFVKEHVLRCENNKYMNNLFIFKAANKERLQQVAGDAKIHQ